MNARRSKWLKRRAAKKMDRYWEKRGRKAFADAFVIRTLRNASQHYYEIGGVIAEIAND